MLFVLKPTLFENGDSCPGWLLHNFQYAILFSNKEQHINVESEFKTDKKIRHISSRSLVF